MTARRNVDSSQSTQERTRPHPTMKRLLFLALFAAIPVCAMGQTTYSVRFDSEWSASTHPSTFPSNPHMSPLIGATHSASYSMWAPGQTARTGLEAMAETGGTVSLRAEVETRISFGSAFSVISGGGIGVSPGAVETTFEIAASHPLVSLVSMIAPSPDWFVGVHDVSLVENGEWVSSLTLDLFPYDSGTDSGDRYTSANADTNPAEPIAALTDSPFVVNGQLVRIGTFTFTCISGCGAVVTETEDRHIVPQEFSIGTPFPNPARDLVSVPVTPGDVAVIRVDLTNAIGQTVTFSTPVNPGGGEQVVRLPVDSLAPGVWFIRVAGGNHSAVSRVILTR